MDSSVAMPVANTSGAAGGNALSSGIVSTVAAGGLGTSSTANGSGPTPGLGTLQSSGRRNYRQTVCRHWLRGLCMKGDVCGFLHQLDRSRMPVCRFFTRHGECHEPDCVYKHTYEDIKECNMSVPLSSI
jgi:cleavage and polyadenylation specificity factor subunit 4